jgi:hypothetical protein
VRGLELRVSELEGQLAKIEASSALSNASNTGNAPQEGDRIKHQELTHSKKTCPAAPDSHAVSAQWAMPDGLPATRPRRSTSLADGLKMLSLEATAERYVGPPSGVAIAKLTQAILRRLSLDQKAFVFGDGEEGSGAGVGEADMLPSFECTLDFLDLDMMLDSPQQLTSLPTNPIGQGSESPLDLAQLEAGRIRFLLDFYFAHSHPLYPIVQQRRFVKTLRTAYKDSFQGTGPVPGVAVSHLDGARYRVYDLPLRVTDG